MNLGTVRSGWGATIPPVLLVCACVVATVAQAHTGALAAYELRATGTQVIAAWNADEFVSQGGLTAPVLDGCSPASEGSTAEWSCPKGLAGVTVDVPGLAQVDGQVVVTVVRPDGTVRGMLDPRATRWEVPSPEESDGTLGAYFEQGVIHIAIGADHLVFVLGLLLLVPSLRALVGVITAFTLGHSVTLGIATATGVAPASAPTEALIAGSILLLARELVVSRREGRNGLHPAGLAAVFGLVHGVGFSGALADVGIPAGEMVAALLGFNLGVEAGQLVFVAVLSAAGLLLGRVWESALASVRAVAPYAIGAVAASWFVERLAVLG